MEEVRATLDDTGRLLGQELSSSGLNWAVPALYKRYGFLRRLKEEVFFDLLYYPYWRILDGVSARSQKLIQAPESVRERIVFAEGPEDCAHPDNALKTCGGRQLAEALVFRGEDFLVRARAHVVSCTVTKEEALQKGYSDLLRDMGKFYNRPLGLWATMTSLGQEAARICKPFWIMRSQSHEERLFVFDASTGLGGVAEYWNVVDYLTNTGGEG